MLNRPTRWAVGPLSAALAVAAISGALFVAARQARAAEPGGSSAEQRLKAFQWFSTLGYPEVKGLKFVRVATGFWSQSGGNPPENQYWNGFVLDEKGKDFRVFTFTAETYAFTKTPQGTPAHERVSYETKDLVEYAAAELKSLRDRASGKEPEDVWRRFGKPLSEPAEVFVLAWACWRQGHEQAAADLFDQAAKTGVRQGGNASPGALQQRVATDLAYAKIWRDVLAFGDTSIPREQLLARFEEFLKHFPDGDYAPLAKETAAILKSMVQEDKDHAARQAHGKPFPQLTQAEQIAELIFQLRDQHGEQMSQPGECDIFLTFDSKEDSAAHRLVKIGYDAVPQLIAALDDKRFSRSVGYWRNFTFSHYVLTVGDCAEAILAQIAGRPFYTRHDTNGYMSKDKQTAAVKKEVEAWYAEFKKKGEKQMLLEGTERGDHIGANLAERLVEKYPAAALPALLAGVAHAKDQWVRTHLVELVGQVPGDGPISFLLGEVKNGPSVEARLTAARALHERKRPEGVATMIDEWNGRNVKNTGVEPLDAVGSFLAGCGKLEAIEALEKGLDKRPIDARLAVVSAFGESGNMAVFSTGEGGELAPGKAAAVRQRKELFDAAVELLVKSLDDTEERTGMSGTWNGKSFSDPRICDIAGYVLNQLDPRRFPFDLAAQIEERDRSRAILRNVWRKEQGLPEVKLETRKIAAVPDEQLQPLLERLRKASAAEGPAASAEIEKLGIGALAGIFKRLKSLPANDPQQAALDRLARRLASTIVEVQIADKSLKPDAALAAKLDKFKDKPLDEKALVETMTSLANGLARPVHGFQITIVRSGDGTGTTLRLDLLDKARADSVVAQAWLRPDDDDPKDRPYVWNRGLHVRVGNEVLHDSAGMNRSLDVAELAKIVENSSSAPADKSVEIRVTIIGVWRN